jgi:hypothetical protein
MLMSQARSLFLTLGLLFLLPACSLFVPGYKVFTSGKLAQKNFRVEIPFTYFQNLMIIEARLGNEKQPRKWLLDTGAVNLIKSSALPDSGFQQKGSITVQTATSQRGKLPTYLAEQIHLGELTIEKNGFAVVDDDSMVQKNPVLACVFREVDGLIGANLMRFARWEIDHERQIITITDDPEAFPPTTESHEISFETGMQGTPKLWTQLDSVPVRFTLDTGSNGHLRIGKTGRELLLKRDSLRPQVRVFGKASAGLFGSDRDTSYYLPVDSIRMGDLGFDSLVVRVEKSENYLLGNAFLRNYRMVLDWEKMTVTLTPIKAYHPPRKLSGFGFSALYEDSLSGMYVSALYLGSRAEQAGLSLGMSLLQLGSDSLTDLTHPDFCYLLKRPLIPDSLQSLEVRAQQGDSLLEVELQREVFWDWDKGGE